MDIDRLYPRSVIRSTVDRELNVPNRPVILVLAAIVVSELAIFVGRPMYALWGHLVVLVACSLAPLRYRGDATVFLALALLPLFRLVNLGMPVFFEVTLYWLPLIYGSLLPGIYLFVRNSDVDIEFGAGIGLASLPVVVPLSAVLASVEYSLIEPQALVPALTPFHLLAITVVMVGFVGLVEELLFRGILQRVLERRFGTLLGLLIASGLFGLLHSGYGVALEMPFAATIGLLFGVLYDWTDSIVLVSLLHGLLNVFLLAVIPLSGSVVPGL